MRITAVVALLSGASLPLAGSCMVVTDFDDLGGGAAATTTSSGGGAGGNGAGGSASGGAGGVAGAGGSGGSGGSSGQGGSSGGGGGSTPCPPANVDYGGLVLNELAPVGAPDDWIELKNTSDHAIAMCAVFITQKYDGTTPPSGTDRYTFGPVEVGAGQFLVIQRNVDFPFGLAKDEPERITLFAPDATLLDDTSWQASPQDEFTATMTWARIADGTGSFQRTCSPTKNAANVDAPCNGG